MANASACACPCCECLCAMSVCVCKCVCERESVRVRVSCMCASQVEIPANVTLRQLASRLGCTPSQLEVWLRDEMSESVASEYDTVSAEAAELAAMEWGRTPVMTTWADVAGMLDTHTHTHTHTQSEREGEALLQLVLACL